MDGCPWAKDMMLATPRPRLTHANSRTRTQVACSVQRVDRSSVGSGCIRTLTTWGGSFSSQREFYRTRRAIGCCHLSSPTVVATL